MDTRALWYVAPGRAEIRLGAPGTGPLLVETLWSGLSRGTERLIFEGLVPPGEFTRMRAPMQEGELPFPVKYGYANAGRVREGPPQLLGRTVFALAPHQAAFRAGEEQVLPLPEGVPPRRATLAANMETALNAIWDAGLAPGSNVAVIGAGLVGCLTAYLARHQAGCTVTLVDPREERRLAASELGVNFAPAGTPLGECGTVFHASASAEGLAAGLDMLALEGTLIEMSWYGAEPVPVPLGGAFHANRLRIVSSQVGHVAPSRRATTTRRGRLAEALALLADPRLDGLITTEIAFEELPARLPALLARDAPGIATAIRYQAHMQA
ncbi:MAG TPA: zinc-binding alcohol dehydrogenase [Paracoccaceae bacterium]|nr:zinc-binding alcohol dehydrogenase [Paracoccaceae bacterium]